MVGTGANHAIWAGMYSRPRSIAFYLQLQFAGELRILKGAAGFLKVTRNLACANPPFSRQDRGNPANSSTSTEVLPGRLAEGAKAWGGRLEARRHGRALGGRLEARRHGRARSGRLEASRHRVEARRHEVAGWKVAGTLGIGWQAGS